MTINQAAEILGVHAATINNYVSKTGQLKARKVKNHRSPLGYSWDISEASVTRLAEKRGAKLKATTKTTPTTNGAREMTNDEMLAIGTMIGVGRVNVGMIFEVAQKAAREELARQLR